MRIVFMGSPEFALPTLRTLAANHQVAGVVTQPDRGAGRGRQVASPPVKVLAQELPLPYIQPQDLKNEGVLGQLGSWAPELIVVAAYGKILPPEILDLPELGSLNVHASLLPRWRGAAPVQAAILHGDEETGVTIMKMDPGLDTGGILAQRTTPIHRWETGGELSARLSVLGARLLLETIPAYAEGALKPSPQDDSLATHAPRLKKSDGELRFDRPAAELARQIRAYDPWPRSFLTWTGKRILVLEAHNVEVPATRPGLVVEHEGLPAISTSKGLLVLDKVQAAGKNPASGGEFARGARQFVGSVLAAESQG